MRGRYFSTRDFLKFSRATKMTLHLYDKRGLLPPALRETNSYRYYSSGQMAVVNLIRILQELGMSLDEIQALRDKRTPAQADNMLTRVARKLDKKIDDLLRSRKFLLACQDSIRSVLNVNEKAITIESLPAEPVVLGDVNDYGRGGNDYKALIHFYKSIQARYFNLDLNYPVWAVFSEERIKEGDWKWPDRYYFYNPEGRDERPAALYAVGYARGRYGQTDELYKRIIKYIDRHGFEICGNAYEEYPLNEICVSDADNCLIRVMITVGEK